MNEHHHQGQYIKAKGAVAVLKKRFVDAETRKVTWSVEWVDGPHRRLIGRIREEEILQAFPVSRPTAEIIRALCRLGVILVAVAFLIAIAVWIGTAFYYALPRQRS